MCFIGAAAICASPDKKSSAQEKQPVLKEHKTMTGKTPESTGYNVLGARRTANSMGYEDTAVNTVLRKYLDFIPQAPGNLLDLGCAYGFAVEQMLAIENKDNFLKQRHRKILAVDMSREQLDRMAADSPAELVETVMMHFPNIETEKCDKAFSPGSLGATYAGLILHYLNPDELTRGLKLYMMPLHPAAGCMRR